MEKELQKCKTVLKFLMSSRESLIMLNQVNWKWLMLFCYHNLMKISKFQRRKNLFTKSFLYNTQYWALWWLDAIFSQELIRWTTPFYQIKLWKTLEKLPTNIVNGSENLCKATKCYGNLSTLNFTIISGESHLMKFSSLFL